MRPLKESDPAAAGPYRLLAELGRGGMGRVLLGAAPDGRLVAVKLVHARLADDEGFRVRFRREVAASRKVSGAYTAAVMDADPDAPAPWLASVFVAGPSLGAAVEGGGALPEETVRRLAAGLATALVEIHRAGLVHRDLKPDNVLLAQDSVRVIDFGIARVARPGEVTELTQAGTVIGSPAFMSPEQAEGGELTPASDVFSLGSVLVLAATGRSPFAAATIPLTLYNIVHTEPDLGALPSGLRGIVRRCLAKDPAARPSPAGLLDLIGPVLANGDTGWPPSVHRMAAAQQADVDRLLQGAERTVLWDQGDVAVNPAAPTVTAARETGPAGRPAPRGRRPGRTRLLLAAGVLVVAGAGIGAAYALRSQPPQRPAEPDKYLVMPTCGEAAGKLPLPERDTSMDSGSGGPDHANLSCFWRRAYDVVGGEPEPPAHATIEWYLKRSGRTPGSGKEHRSKGFGSGRTETGLGAGDAAYWGTSPWHEQTCMLYVLDGNLELRVGLAGPEHPAATCETEAKEIARAALAAMPR
ncbi:serine/threonine-protein kinase [Streptomyces sp. NPDC048258]|uniref:serine/threonine-protein kinase n=1 Tax=Streptomyces sp. NPDC048258 TaxID=3365527 RepID=UPI00371D6ED1